MSILILFVCEHKEGNKDGFPRLLINMGKEERKNDESALFLTTIVV